jgi:hypothetical protein
VSDGGAECANIPGGRQWVRASFSAKPQWESENSFTCNEFDSKRGKMTSSDWICSLTSTRPPLPPALGRHSRSCLTRRDIVIAYSRYQHFSLTPPHVTSAIVLTIQSTILHLIVVLCDLSVPTAHLCRRYEFAALQNFWRGTRDCHHSAPPQRSLQWSCRPTT